MPLARSALSQSNLARRCHHEQVNAQAIMNAVTELPKSFERQHRSNLDAPLDAAFARVVEVGKLRGWTRPSNPAKPSRANYPPSDEPKAKPEPGRHGDPHEFKNAQTVNARTHPTVSSRLFILK